MPGQTTAICTCSWPNTGRTHVRLSDTVSNCCSSGLVAQYRPHNVYTCLRLSDTESNCCSVGLGCLSFTPGTALRRSVQCLCFSQKLYFFFSIPCDRDRDRDPKSNFDTVCRRSRSRYTRRQLRHVVFCCVEPLFALR